jgi:RNA polymerase sigma factor (sigma-70 family)
VDWSEIYTRLATDGSDAAAWQALESSVRVWACCALRRCSDTIIEDAVADTCASVAVNLARARGADTFRGFALGHWLNTRRRVLEARAAAATLDSLEAVEDRSSEPDDHLEPDQLAWLHVALEQLPERERRAVVLRYFEGLSACQISAALHVSASNARRLVFNGLTRLRRAAGMHVAARVFALDT